MSDKIIGKQTLCQRFLRIEEVGDELDGLCRERGDCGEHKAMAQRDMAQPHYARVDFGECRFPGGNIAVAVAQQFHLRSKFKMIQEFGISVGNTVGYEPLFEQACGGDMVVQETLSR